MLAVVTILGVISAAGIFIYVQSFEDTQENACYVIREDIALQVRLWHRNKGAWPQSNLSDIGADPSYFPDGLPTSPIDGSAYSLDPDTHEVIGPSN